MYTKKWTLKVGKGITKKKRSDDRSFSVILGGYEPPTSCLSSKRSKPTELKDQYFAKGVARIILFYCICKGFQRRDIRLFHSALDGNHRLNNLDIAHC